MNIYGLEKHLKEARDMLNKELDKKDINRVKIKKIEIGMENLKNKIKELKKERRKIWYDVIKAKLREKSY